MEQNNIAPTPWSEIQIPIAVKKQIQQDLTFFCFDTCISNLRTRDIDRHEQSCLDVCTDKYAQFFMRSGRIFSEQRILRDSIDPSKGSGKPTTYEY